MPNWSVLHLRNRHFVILDVCLLAAIPTMALTLRVNLPWDRVYLQGLLIFTLLALLVKLPVFYAFRLYARYWRYASMDELFAIALAVGVSSVIVTALTYLGQGLNWISGLELPRSLPIIDGLLTLLFIGGTRFSLRAAEYLRARSSSGTPGRRVLIAGISGDKYAASLM